MAIRNLPRRPSLEHLRNEARTLQRLVREGDPTAVASAREFHPRFAERGDSFRLSDAQLTVARSYGHASWPKLKAYVEAIIRYTRDPHEVAQVSSDADEFLRLACLVYGGDDRSRPALAAEMLRRDRSLAGRSIHTAAAAGDAAPAASMLVADRSLATATGGPFDWEPLLYVAYTGTARMRPTNLRTASRWPWRGCSSRPEPIRTTIKRSATATSDRRTTTSSCCSSTGSAGRGAGRGRSGSASI